MPIVDEDNVDSTPLFAKRLTKNFVNNVQGLIIENTITPRLMHIIGVNEYELWLNELEKQVGLPLGRKLAHAASESEELRMINNKSSMPSTIFNKMKKRVAWVNESWELSGLGQFEQMNKKDDEITLIVHNRAHSSFAAGMASAAYEFLTSSRYRFHWSDDGNSESLITLENDSRPIPCAEVTPIPWDDAKLDLEEFDEMHPLTIAYHESSGVWSLDGIRMMCINQDLLLRFEQSVLANLIDKQIPQSNRYKWDDIDDEERAKFWSLVAETSRLRFIARDEMALIAETEHWVNAGYRFLTKFGLGAISDVRSVDEQGGVEITLPKMYHPAITVGILTAAWEKSEAREAKCEWSCSKKGHIIKIIGLRTIA